MRMSVLSHSICPIFVSFMLSHLCQVLNYPRLPVVSTVARCRHRLSTFPPVLYPYFRLPDTRCFSGLTCHR
ncbi:hypothetical protein DFJ58DRAFT_798111 [Suillus subalutaceus]|uniref:uncharacterized protein n=1 Tax=Suillus subalutaceus TaxID=48586 RepID=UPI001B87F340|nr:uncharacterized protein DFJ58DRAFT_798111 [Suillus subalutaceus]KAG1847355.1 hypothetical protein DFJ58DRAFT_798111 [Suillus subalutaceus]